MPHPPFPWKLIFTALVLTILAGGGTATAQPEAKTGPLRVGAAGELIYHSGVRGDRIPDFSYSGYMAGEQPLPDVPARVRVRHVPGDATRQIQAALDYVASLEPGAGGIRGAVLLDKGIYEIRGSLVIRASGVVLRGSGTGKDGTVLLGAGKSRETLIRIAGEDDRETGSPVRIITPYVPVNAVQFEVAPSHGIRAGDQLLVRRPSTQGWISHLGMNEFGGETSWLGWKPGTRDILWDRTVIAVKGNTVTLDAPLTTALDTAFGGGTLATYHWTGRISHTGVENLRCRSAFDAPNPKDEAHRWMAITLEHVRDAWVRQVVFEHFAGSAVAIYETGSRITVEDCISLDPVSEIGGQRRYTFFTSGQQTLFQRLYAEGGYHDFAAGFMAAGPNAFVQCESYRPHSFSGGIDSWASGLLFDNVHIDGGALSFLDRAQDARGAGWTAANSVLWQCAASEIDCYSPPGATNWAFGSWGSFSGNACWESVNDHVEPRSLYYAQLAGRLGPEVLKRANLLPLDTKSSSSPSVEEARLLTSAAEEPRILLREWIGRAHERDPVPVELTGLPLSEEVSTARDKPAGHKSPASGNQPAAPLSPVRVQHGWLVQGGKVLAGTRQEVRWWRGDPRPFAAADAGPHITRFVPGRTGSGFTDDLDALTDSMKAGHVIAMEHNYGLWYDRRRDDHQRVRRMDGDVWAPFYELPFARSGRDTAWDGLSKYDLTKYNHWYWSRLNAFARLAAQKELLLIHQHYFQHNILEAGAHWADFPWRPANNINETGFPEPPPYAGDKRIFMARQFYDTLHSGRRELHRAYIRKCLSNFPRGGNVLHLTGAEFTGPLHFMQFWLDNAIEWEKERGDNVLIGLSATKDVQDAILEDAARADAVEVIDIRYWHYREDGSLYAPEGGQSLAPRQHARLVNPGKESFTQVYRAVYQYRHSYPGKAVIYSAPGARRHPWAVFMAGGSLSAIPPVSEPGFLESAASMQPLPAAGDPSPGKWILANQQGERIVYLDSSGPLQMRLDSAAGTYQLHRIDPLTGKRLRQAESLKGGSAIELKKGHTGPVIFWLSRSLSPGETGTRFNLDEQ